MKLIQSRAGARIRIISLGINSEYVLRVYELGIRPGVECTVVRKVAPNGLVLNIAGSRIAVDTHSAKHIDIEEVK